MWGIIISCLLTVAEGYDVLLIKERPVPWDLSVQVVTFYRNEPNWYYFTLTFRYAPRFELFKTVITFNQDHSRLAQRGSERWARRVYMESNRAGLEMPIQGIPICPFNPEDHLELREYILRTRSTRRMSRSVSF
jgi:hypothetical protein